MSGDDELRALVDRARAPEPEPVAGATTPMVTMQIEGRWLAVAAEAVREVVLLATITSVPGVQAPVRGVVLVRGRLVAVVDLAALLGIARASRAPSTRRRLLVLTSGDDEVGVVADETRGVIELPSVAGTGTGLVRGELRWDGHVVAVLDAKPIVGVASSGAR
jgi:purine-binding chemotaxis protein CheW